jgi:putative monooxygenase ydhR
MKDHCLRNVKERRASGRLLAAPALTTADIANAARPRATEIEEPIMIVTIVTFHLPQPATLADITKTFQGTAPKYQGIPGLLRKNYFMSEDGRRAGGIYVWESRADADRVYTSEWRAFVAGKYGTPPVIEYLHSPVMVDNSAGTISVAA